MRTSSLIFLLMKQVKEVNVNGEKMFRILGQVGSRIGASKTTQGIVGLVGRNVSESYIRDECELDGMVNVY